MKSEWIVNDWYSTVLMIYCSNCGERIYNEVYTIPLTEKTKDRELRQRKKLLPKICPRCKKLA